ncbi:reverse transcriptase-like protein [Sphingomonas sp.]|uniref:reverse transcriptase-like protein n=1 Tax=Sphingomonas sp. TaxID=28214 RepID=UPI000DB226FA|nr:reverse transcriptase-like protein [Sphingomonas sp.]PZU08163.1 MAG: ribonuclease HI [Sphingomonas sp.]
MGLKIYFDGGCRPNPGRMETAVVARGRAYVDPDAGQGDNNDAEWAALIHALRIARSLGATDVILLGDSTLIVQQANGIQPCRVERFRDRFDEYRALAPHFHRVRIRHVRRAQNLAGIALDRRRAMAGGHIAGTILGG